MIARSLSAFWPPAGQRLLLTAAVAPLDEARAAWADWAHSHDIEKASWFEARLFASLAPRLATLVDAEDIPARLQGLRRYVWVRTQNTLVGSAPLLMALSKSGVRMMPLKGAARHASAGADQPSRCLTDIDLLIHPEDWATAIRTAYDNGWTCRNAPIGEGLPVDEFLRVAPPFHHSFCFMKGEIELDLHHKALLMSRDSGDDDALWRRAEPGRLSGVPVSVPCPTDQLFVTLAHALLHGPEPSGDWMLDAAALIGSGRIDWDLLATEAEQRLLVPSVAVPLAFLARETALAIPPATLKRLKAGMVAPYIDDFIGFAETYKPDRPRLIDASRSAASARALAAFHRHGRAVAADATAEPGRLLIEAQPALRPDGNCEWLPVPFDLSPDTMTELELSFEPNYADAGGREVIFDLVAPGMILKRWMSGSGLLARLRRRRRVTLMVPFPLALFTERGIRWFGVQVPSAADYPALPIRNVRITWRVAGNDSAREANGAG